MANWSKRNAHLHPPIISSLTCDLPSFQLFISDSAFVVLHSLEQCLQHSVSKTKKWRNNENLSVTNLYAKSNTKIHETQPQICRKKLIYSFLFVCAILRGLFSSVVFFFFFARYFNLTFGKSQQTKRNVHLITCFLML